MNFELENSFKNSHHKLENIDHIEVTFFKIVDGELTDESESCRKKKLHDDYEIRK